jgi:predicted transposase YbfD/YdcC
VLRLVAYGHEQDRPRPFCGLLFVLGGRLLADQPDLIAIDGKTSRRSHDRKTGQRALHLVSAFATTSRLVLGQEAVDEKSNEITAIPALLDRIELAGATVTIDAMGCQRDIAQKILDKSADYVLALKGNQGSLREDVELFAAEQKANGFSDTKVSRIKPSMAITAASKRESTLQSMTWPGCRNATIGPD